MFKLQLNIYHQIVEIHSDEDETLNKLAKDFSLFIDHDQVPSLYLSVFHQAPPLDKLPEQKATAQTSLCAIYDTPEYRLVNYQNRALCFFDQEKDKAKLYGQDKDLLHELSYLFILSRTGKRMDLQGLHKLHAFGIEKAGTTLLGVMPSGGGKSTLLKEFLKDSSINFFSDDTPVVDTRGNIHPFPLRLGLSEPPLDLVSSNQLYTLKRRQYGTKYLLDVTELHNGLAQSTPRIVLMTAERSERADCRARKRSKLRMFFILFHSMIIGVGLPMVFEYFWIHTWRDFVLKTGIFFSRLKAAFNLLRRAECYHVQLTQSPEQNVDFLKRTFLVPSSKKKPKLKPSWEGTSQR